MNRFVVNVAINGMHYCRIELPETIESNAKAKARTLRDLFRHISDKAETTLTRWNDIGHDYEF